VGDEGDVTEVWLRGDALEYRLKSCGYDGDFLQLQNKQVSPNQFCIDHFEF